MWFNINELITNSLKYAFPNDQEGQISIDFKSEADTMLLTVGDDGVGFPADLNLENTQTLGLQLVRLLTTHDLRGSVDVGNGHKKGTKYIIKFPLPKRVLEGDVNLKGDNASC